MDQKLPSHVNKIILLVYTNLTLRKYSALFNIEKTARWLRPSLGEAKSQECRKNLEKN